MSKTTKTTKPIVTEKEVNEAAKRIDSSQCHCKDCVCIEDDKELKAKQLEWYDSMIEAHKQSMKEGSRNAKWGLAVMVLFAIAMLTIIIVNIIRCVAGE